jgi:hypothetical protein
MEQFSRVWPSWILLLLILWYWILRSALHLSFVVNCKLFVHTHTIRAYVGGLIPLMLVVVTI